MIPINIRNSHIKLTWYCFFLYEDLIPNFGKWSKHLPSILFFLREPNVIKIQKFILKNSITIILLNSKMVQNTYKAQSYPSFKTLSRLKVLLYKKISLHFVIIHYIIIILKKIEYWFKRNNFFGFKAAWRSLKVFFFLKVHLFNNIFALHFVIKHL